MKALVLLMHLLCCRSRKKENCFNSLVDMLKWCINGHVAEKSHIIAALFSTMQNKFKDIPKYRSCEEPRLLCRQRTQLREGEGRFEVLLRNTSMYANDT